MSWKEISQIKLGEIHTKLSRKYDEASTITETDKKLADLSAEELHDKLVDFKKRNITSNDLVKAICLFHARQAEANNSYHLLTNVLTDDALRSAKELETKITPANVDKYPLYGYILSIKESIRMKGQISSGGLVCGLHECAFETPFIDYLHNQGAVTMSRGNVPQILLAMESNNNVYGSTSNPYNPLRSSGGSSGGDAALVAIGHVNAAIGSDIAGSLRIPALFCGIYTMNITSARIDGATHILPFEYHANAKTLGDKQYAIPVTIGPLTKTLRDLSKLTEVIVNYHNENPRIPPVPWNHIPKKITKVGIITEWDNLFALTKTNRRAMEMAVNALHQNGIQTVDIDMRPYIAELIQHVACVHLKNERVQQAINGKIDMGEPLIPQYANFAKMLKAPKFMLKLMDSTSGDIKKRTYIKACLNSQRYNINWVKEKIDAIKSRFMRQLAEAGVEVWITPGMMPAILKDLSKDCNIWAGYMMIWNAFKCSAGAMPITAVQNDEQTYESNMNFDFEESMRQNMKDSAGLPVGIQVVAGPWHEEEVLQVMKVIDDTIHRK
jgi:fatty acid amide hydrolase